MNILNCLMENFPLWVGPLICYAGYKATHSMIPTIRDRLFNHGICGKNIHCINKRVIPESLGIVPGTVYIILVIFLQIFKFLPIEFNAALTSICLMIFLGFVDDVLNLPWRYKLILPFVATLPLLLAYNGETSVLLPIFIRKIFNQTYLDLGNFYVWGYMLCFSIFCTNSINIHAGVNGLEVGQSLVIATFVMLFNVIEIWKEIAIVTAIYPFKSYFEILPMILEKDIGASRHIFSLLMMLPFFGTSFALYQFNSFPASVFVGDSYTNFAGMTFAVVGILGHFSKTMILFFCLQLINFIISMPQLLGFLPCDRHRLPVLDKKKMVLVPQWRHWNILNKLLEISGPLSEKATNRYCLSVQIILSLILFAGRYKILTTLF